MCAWWCASEQVMALEHYQGSPSGKSTVELSDDEDGFNVFNSYHAEDEDE